MAMDIINVIIGLLLMLLSLLIGVPAIKDKLEGKADDYGWKIKLIGGSLCMFIVGIGLVLREFF